MEDKQIEQYLKKINFDKQYKKFIKKYKDKKIIIYGAGQFFRIIFSKYDFSMLNIIGICDRSFSKTGIKEFYGYKTIFVEDLYNYEPDLIVTATLEYLNLIEYIQKDIFHEKKMEIRPLAYMPMGMFLRELIFGPDKYSPA